MESGLVSLMGRLLIVPVALSGVCLSMFIGIPMAGAMTIDHTVMSTDILDDHGMTVVENHEQESQSACCIRFWMKHDTKATTPDQRKTSAPSFVADMPKKAAAWVSEGTASVWAPPNSLSLHRPFSLLGIVVKRE